MRECECSLNQFLSFLPISNILLYFMRLFAPANLYSLAEINSSFLAFLFFKATFSMSVSPHFRDTFCKVSSKSSSKLGSKYSISVHKTSLGTSQLVSLRARLPFLLLFSSTKISKCFAPSLAIDLVLLIMNVLR